ncbi:MAG: aspartate kinase [Bacteroidota bacterium]|nr:aspartate kinase [Bacteroidota bacterium]
MRVMKFGGTSVANAKALQHAAHLVLCAAVNEQILVVVSAFRGVTDELLGLVHSAARGQPWEARWHALAQRHRQVAQELGILPYQPLDELLEYVHAYCSGVALLGECTPRMLDEIAACGELLSSHLLAAYLRSEGGDVEWFDVRYAIKTNAHFTAAQVEWQLTATAVETELRPVLDRHRIVVTQGFIASTRSGLTTTLGRGGSDYSAAILGACLHAEGVEIWTDVSGIFSADPRIVPDAVSLPQMTLGEIAALSAYGARVLHPLTIVPAIEHGIPVTVRNTFEPQHPGTQIVDALPEAQWGIRALVGCAGYLQQGMPFPGDHHLLASVHLRGETYSITASPNGMADQAIDLICAVGEHLHAEGVALKQIATAAKQLSCRVQVVASARYCMLIRVEQCSASAFIQALHAVVREQLMEMAK